jgi:hypothetical protein
MNIISLVFFALIASISATNCEAFTNGYSNTITDCSILTVSECGNYYQFSWNGATDVPNDLDVYPCKVNTSNQCVLDLTHLCQPSCLLAKTGGPSGKFCSDFTTVSTCKAYYADHNGDRWCAWHTSTNTCYEALICHN